MEERHVLYWAFGGMALLGGFMTLMGFCYMRFLRYQEEQEWNHGRCSWCNKPWRYGGMVYPEIYKMYACDCRQITITTKVDGKPSGDMLREPEEEYGFETVQQ